MDETINQSARSFCRLISGRLLDKELIMSSVFYPKWCPRPVKATTRRPSIPTRSVRRPKESDRAARLLCWKDSMMPSSAFPFSHSVPRSPDSAIAQTTKKEEEEPGSRYHQLTMDDDGNKPTNTVRAIHGTRVYRHVVRSRPRPLSPTISKQQQQQQKDQATQEKEAWPPGLTRSDESFRLASKIFFYISYSKFNLHVCCLVVFPQKIM